MAVPVPVPLHEIVAGDIKPSRLLTRRALEAHILRAMPAVVRRLDECFALARDQEQVFHRRIFGVEVRTRAILAQLGRIDERVGDDVLPRGMQWTLGTGVPQRDHHFRATKRVVAIAAQMLRHARLDAFQRRDATIVDLPNDAGPMTGTILIFKLADDRCHADLIVLGRIAVKRSIFQLAHRAAFAQQVVHLPHVLIVDVDDARVGGHKAVELGLDPRRHVVAVIGRRRPIAADLIALPPQRRARLIVFRLRQHLIGMLADLSTRPFLIGIQ